MTIKICTIVAALASLTACQTFKPAEKTADQLAKENYICDAKKLQTLVGEQANENTGELALKKSYAKTLRWIAPDTAVTKDYRRDRLNINYDESMKIQRVSCG